MKNSQLTMIVFLAVLLSANQLFADNTSMRCGNKLVSIGETMYEVRDACGNPFSEQRIGEKRTFKTLKDNQLEIESLIYINEWYYKRGDGTYILTFEGSRLVKKEYKK
jgi:hypothetical protein